MIKKKNWLKEFLTTKPTLPRIPGGIFWFEEKNKHTQEAIRNKSTIPGNTKTDLTKHYHKVNTKIGINNQ